MTSTSTRYIEPDWFSAHVLNPSVRALTRWGLSVWGTRILEVEGRKSGEIRTTVVNLLDVDGESYLVAPRGVTQWVRNLRAAGGGVLRVGRRRQQFTAVELTDSAKAAVLRPYLRRWKWEVGQFFDGVGPDASDEELLAIAPGYPVFQLTTG
jgi:deazaflavin-dependent oxidoreductase (nitroreductase family)